MITKYFFDYFLIIFATGNCPETSFFTQILNFSFFGKDFVTLQLEKEKSAVFFINLIFLLEWGALIISG
jgi:hypothetical protein